MEKNRMSNDDRILLHLSEFGSITSWEAIKEYGITRLSAVIFDLRKRGYHIESVTEYSKNRYGRPVKYARYDLIEEPTKKKSLLEIMHLIWKN